MTLQGRLLCSLGLAFVLLWLVAAGILYINLDRRLSDTLDQRLAASGRMVAGLIARNPALANSQKNGADTRADPLLVWPDDKGTACQIRSRSGQVLLRTGGERGARLATTEPGFSERDIAGHRWRLYTLRQNGLWITVADRESQRDALRRGVMLAMILPFALALLGGMAVLWTGVRRGLRPLRRLRQELERRQPDNLAPVDIGPAPAELAPITDRLNTLFERVAGAMRREQRFAAQAAHEFRTPLTAIKTHLQIARQVSGERLHGALDDAEQGVARLQRVAEQLLMLARLENRREWGEPACLLSEALCQVLADLPERERERVKTSGTGAATRLPLPAALAAVALRNLIDNALRYTPAGKPVEIFARDNDGGVAVCVRDFGGDSVSPAGHGLGRVIVETIVQHFGGALHSETNPYGGSDSVLRLPRDETC